VEDVQVHPTQGDLKVLREWWGHLRPAIPPDARGLWFGITGLEHGGALRSLYVAGCPTFDAGDSTGDWATDYCWWPTDRYVTPADFALLPDQPYQDVLAYAAGLVRNLDATQIPTVEGAAVGFDDGDFVII
jgi:hypothetical protein